MDEVQQQREVEGATEEGACGMTDRTSSSDGGQSIDHPTITAVDATVDAPENADNIAQDHREKLTNMPL